MDYNAKVTDIKTIMIELDPKKTGQVEFKDLSAFLLGIFYIFLFILK